MAEAVLLRKKRHGGVRPGTDLGGKVQVAASGNRGVAERSDMLVMRIA